MCGCVWVLQIVQAVHLLLCDSEPEPESDPRAVTLAQQVLAAAVGATRTYAHRTHGATAQSAHAMHGRGGFAEEGGTADDEAAADLLDASQ